MHRHFARTLGGLIAFTLAMTVQAQEISLTAIPEGAAKMIGSFRPVKVSTKAGVKSGIRAPSGLVAPTYGEIHLQNTTFGVIVDCPPDGDYKVYVDSNSDRDFTNDPPVILSKSSYSNSETGPKYRLYLGFPKVDLFIAGNRVPASIGLYLFDRQDPQRSQFKNSFFYYSDFAEKGVVTFGNKKYDFLLSDPTASASSPADPNPVLYIDRKGNSKWGTKQDQYSLVAPIDLSHQTLKVDDVSFLEGSIFFSPSKAPVPEVPLPNLLEDGDVTPSFKEVTLGKKKIDFPREYRGKVVLLDFWATWCVPCMKEMPNVVQNYQKFHSTGFDVLGISLDNRETSKRIGSVARATGMDWDQICDFQLWKAQVAQLYSVTAIPQSYLIDGTTGKVLASGLELRGQGLGIALSRIFPKP